MVSVIVPVYNVEKYLDRCAESLFSQTYKNLEIIFVDDGSPDNCPSMCDAFAEKDSRVKVVHKANGGLPDARNAGMEVATGKYILFVDSDDWIEENTVEELLHVIVNKKVDFVIFGAVWDGRQGIPDGTPCTCERSRELGKGYYDSERKEKEIYPRILVTPDLFFGPILSSCFMFYSKRFLDENGIRFNPEIKYSEDAVFSARVAHAAKSFFVHDKNYYHYCFNGASISQSYKSDLWDVSKIRYSFFEKYFKGCTEFDSKVQLQRIAIFCVLGCLSRNRALETEKEQTEQTRLIFNDPFTVNAMKHINQAKVPFKKKILLYLIKFKCVKLYMQIFGRIK